MFDDFGGPIRDHTRFTVLCGGSVIQAPPFDVVCRRLILRRGAVDFLQKAAKFLENIEVPEVGPKSAPLKTSTT